LLTVAERRARDVEGTTIEHVKYGALSLAYWY